MALVKKLALVSIFISILCIFGMSYNANAIEFTLNLNDYSIRRNTSRPRIDLFWNGDTTTCSNVAQCQVYNTLDYSHVQKMKTTSSFSANMDDIFVLRVLIGNQAIGGIYTSGAPFIQRNYTTNDDYLIYLGENVVDVSNQNILSQLGYGPNADEYYTQLSTVYQSLTVHEYYFKVLRDGNYFIGFESSNYNSNTANIFDIPAYSNTNAVYFAILNSTQYQFSGSEENKEVEQKTQEAVDDSQAAGSGSSSSASQGGANLLSAITGFFNVITSAQPTNCRFNAPLNTYFGNQNLNVDLCALDLPSGIGALTSIIAIGILIPFAIHMFNKFIALFRSFQS